MRYMGHCPKQWEEIGPDSSTHNQHENPDDEADGGFARHAVNVTIYSLVAKAGPHQANGLTVLEFIDRALGLPRTIPDVEVAGVS